MGVKVGVGPGVSVGYGAVCIGVLVGVTVGAAVLPQATIIPTTKATNVLRMSLIGACYPSFPSADSVESIPFSTISPTDTPFLFKCVSAVTKFLVTFASTSKNPL